MYSRVQLPLPRTERGNVANNPRTEQNYRKTQYFQQHSQALPETWDFTSSPRFLAAKGACQRSHFPLDSIRHGVKVLSPDIFDVRWWTPVGWSVGRSVSSTIILRRVN